MLQILPPKSDKGAREAQWYSLAETTFPALRQSFANSEQLDFDALRRGLDTWQEFVRTYQSHLREHHPDTLGEWERLRAMLWCAEYVQKINAESKGSPLPTLLDLPAGCDPLAKKHKAWALACVRIFQGEKGKTLAVPIALTDLTKTFPRSPGEVLGGLASLARIIDKSSGVNS